MRIILGWQREGVTRAATRIPADEAQAGGSHWVSMDLTMPAGPYVGLKRQGRGDRTS